MPISTFGRVSLSLSLSLSISLSLSLSLSWGASGKGIYGNAGNFPSRFPGMYLVLRRFRQEWRISVFAWVRINTPLLMCFGNGELRGPAEILFISRETCSDSMAKRFRACFCGGGGSHNYRAICCKGGVLHRCTCVKLSTKGGYRTLLGAANLFRMIVSRVMGHCRDSIAISRDMGPLSQEESCPQNLVVRIARPTSLAIWHRTCSHHKANCSELPNRKNFASSVFYCTLSY